MSRLYNRYIRDQQGIYTRVSEADPSDGHPQAPPPIPDTAPFAFPDPPPPPGGLLGSFGNLFQKFGLSGIDTGDLLLLGIIFLLFTDGNRDNEELLIALGLLLIL